MKPNKSAIKTDFLTLEELEEDGLLEDEMKKFSPQNIKLQKGRSRSFNKTRPSIKNQTDEQLPSLMPSSAPKLDSKFQKTQKA